MEIWDFMQDVGIIGGGPVGLYLGGLLKEEGVSFRIFEEHKGIGLPCHCSGLVSRNLGRLLKVNPDFIEHEVRGAVLHSPGGHEIRVEKKGPAAYVIDRPVFDRSLAEGIEEYVCLDSRVVDIDFENRANENSVKILSEKENKRTENGFDMVAGCDGANSLLARQLGASPKEILNGLICILDRPDRSDFVELWYDREKTDGFFWKIPRGKSTEYGMAGTNAKFSDLERFFRLKGPMEKGAGLIPLGDVKTFSSRALLAGDAACQVKGWSGGGVIYGLTAAREAAKTIKKAVDRNDFSGNILKGYEKGWKKEFGRDHSLGLIFRAMYRDMKNQDIDMLFEKAGKMKGLNNMDMDFPSRFLFSWRLQ